MPAGRDQLGGRKPVSPGPAASSSTVAPAASARASTSQRDTGSAQPLVAPRLADQPAGRLPALADATAQCSSRRRRTAVVGPTARSSAAQQLARRRARQLVGELDRLGHLVAARGAAGSARAARPRRPAPSAQHDVATTASPHSRVRAAVDGGLGDRRVLEQDRLDLGRRDVLAAGDDRVGLAPETRQAPVAVERAEVAGVQQPAPARPGATVGRATRISPSSAIARACRTAAVRRRAGGRRGRRS